MKKYRWQILLSAALVALSAALYLLHYAFFRDVHHIFIYLVGDVAFVPIEVLLVTIIIHRLLSFREKRSMLNKLNMVIGAFFSEVGTKLLRRFSQCDADPDRLAESFAEVKDWTDDQFASGAGRAVLRDLTVDPRKGDLPGLREFLAARRTFLLGLLENPNLLEHERFTNLLWAVFHLAEELENRQEFGKLPDTDVAHLAGDIRRAYSRLLVEWLAYMRHLKRDYPYLFSLAVRTNPLDASASAVVT